MSAVPHQLILASAGTGKTYRLTGRFLALLLRGVEPDRILATTFTRKAAGEILDRVLERLVDAAEDGEQCAELAEALALPRLEPADCLALLARLTRSIDSFRVRTIDSFFVGLVKLFALDLGLPPNWRLSNPRLDDRLKSDAIGDALEAAPSGELIELLRKLSEGDAGQGVHRLILDRVTRLRSIYLESDEGAWQRLQPRSDVSDAAFEAALAAMEEAELPLTNAGKVNASWAKAWSKLAQSARDGDWISIMTSGPSQKVFNGEDRYSRVEITEDLYAVLAPIVQRACQRWMSDLASRNLALRSLLERFEVAYEARKRSSGAYGFDDLPLTLAPRGARALPLDERELDIWFRMDGQIDHLLLDEFQDTSPIQWRVLRQIASEIVADGTGERSFFCVGDVKQSIYGFRQAEPRLLSELKQSLPGLASEEMDVSYRSSRVVLEAVNMIFGDIAANASFAPEALEPYRRAAKKWQEGFHAHAPNAERPGAVCVHEAEPPGEDRQDFEPLLDLTVQRVEALTAEAPQAEIGILVRMNKRIPPLLQRLKKRGIEASGEGGNELVDSSAVLAYVALLHLADHPEDSAAAFQVEHSPLGEYAGLREGASPELVRDFARGVRRRIAEQGIGNFSAELASRVEQDQRWSDWDKTRFEQLVEMAFAFEEEAGLRPSEFVDQLRRERVPAPGGARVRVMTVHAAKGLEFDCVILPELNQAFVGQRGGTLTERPHPEGLIEWVSASPSQKLLAADEDLERLYHGTTQRTVEDGLSNLYVAMTRAARRLELLVPNRGIRGGGDVPSMADFVLAALPAGEVADSDEAGPIWSHPGNAVGSAWARSAEGEPAQTPAAGHALPGLGLAPSRAVRGLPRRSPSAEEGGARVRGGRLLAPRGGSRRGSLVHAWLERLEWLEDFELDRERLLAEGAALEPDRAAREAALDELARALERPEIRDALSLEASGVPEGVHPSVRLEHRFSAILPGQAGDELWTGSIDRLVLERRGEEVIGATVIDYKTDRIGEDELLERVEFYRPQLDGYARVVAAQTGLEPAAVSKRLLFLHPGRTMDLA